MRTIDSLMRPESYERNTVTKVIGHDKKGRLRLGKTKAMEKIK
jgi:hypothetical protein